MNKPLLILLLLALPYVAVSQISIREANVVEKAVLHPERFNGLENLNRLDRGKEYNIKKYLEQEVFFIPLSEAFMQKERERKENIDRAKAQLDSLQKIEKAYADTVQMLREKKGFSLGGFYGIGAKLGAKKQQKNEEYSTLYMEARVGVSNQKERLKNLEYSSRPYSPYGRGLSYASNRDFFACDSLGKITKQVFYSEIQNKYYTIVDLLKGSVNAEGSGAFSRADTYTSELAFLLKERDSGEWILWCFGSPDSDFNRDFALLTSYFVKAKESFEGQNLIATYDKSGLVDINTGELVDIRENSKWMCKELTLIPLEKDPLLAPFFILENQSGETVKWSLPDKLADTEHLPGLITEKQYVYIEQQKQMLEEQRLAEQKVREEQEKKNLAQFRQTCIQKYGQRLGTLICEGKVALGMTQEMCTLAWGEPYRKNRTLVAGVSDEQWVYGWYHYLYFTNGILKGIQD